MAESFKTHRLWWIVGGIAVLLAALLLGSRLLSPPEPAEAQSDDVVTAFIGDLAASATASGNVIAQRSANLSAETPGIVQELFVRAGDSVSADDPLVVLDADELELAVRTAEQNLAIAEANLASLVATPTTAEVASAEAQLESAQAQLDAILSGPTEPEIAAQEADLRAAEANVSSSFAQFNQTQNAISDADVAAAEAALAAAEANLKSVEIQYTRNPDPDNIQANTALAQAREQVASAQARLDTLLAGPDSNSLGSAQANLSNANANRDAVQANLDQLTADPALADTASAEAAVAQAQSALDDLIEGPSEADIAAAEADVEQARINLENASDAAAQATIRAPYDGVITTVAFNPGELASGTIAKIVDSDSLEVVLEVDEVDVADLVVGQPAIVTLETWPNVEIESEVVRIAPAPVSTGLGDSAIITYEVRLSLGETDLPVRVGMTANANLITAEKEDVLLVPNAAIIADRGAGTYSVNLVTAEGVQSVDVTIGLRDDDYTEITSGLQEGDQILIGTNAPVATFGPDAD